MPGRTKPTLSLQIYRYGEPGPRDGLSVGVTHYLPRGVRREDHAAKGYFSPACSMQEIEDEAPLFLPFAP